MLPSGYWVLPTKDLLRVLLPTKALYVYRLLPTKDLLCVCWLLPPKGNLFHRIVLPFDAIRCV